MPGARPFPPVFWRLPCNTLEVFGNGASPSRPYTKLTRLLKVHNRREGLCIEARPADQRAVQFFLRHQALYVVGLHAAAIKNPQRGRKMDGEPFPRATAEQAMGLRGNFR